MPLNDDNYYVDRKLKINHEAFIRLANCLFYFIFFIS